MTKDEKIDALASALVSYYFPGVRGTLNSNYEECRDMAREVLFRLERHDYTIRRRT